MSKGHYIIRFDSKDDYKNHKDKLIASSEYTKMNGTTNFWVIHYLTVEEYEKIKSYGIHITYDALTLSTCEQ